MELLLKERKREQEKSKERKKEQLLNEKKIDQNQGKQKDMPEVPMALPIKNFESWNKQNTKEKVVKNFGGTRMKNKVFLLISMFIMSLVAMCTCAYAADELSAPDVLITEWTVPAGTTIKLPISTNAVNNYKVDFGDGTVQNYTTEDFPAHTYASAGTYTIRIKGSVNKFGYSLSDENTQPTETNAYSDYYTFTQYVTKLVAWGELNAEQYGFAYCRNLAGNIPEPTVNSFQKVRNFNALFYFCSKLAGTIPANLFANCPKASIFTTAFYNCRELTGNIPANLFANCPNATEYRWTFYGCRGLTGTIPANLFANCPVVTDFNSTFYGCSGLTENVPVELFANNTAITVPENTDASNASLASTFYHCTGLTGVNMNTPYIGYQMFYGCNNLTDITIGNNVQAIATEAFKATSPYSAENPLTTTLKTNNSVAQNYDWTGVNRGATIQNIEEEHPWYDEGVLDLVAPSITDVQATLTSEGIKVTATIADPVLPDGTAGSGINTSKTRYMLTETSTKPSAEPGAAERAWQESATLTLPDSGRYFYVWVKAEDNVGNVTISDGTFVDLLAYAESVTIPTIEGSYVYDGTEQTVTLANFDSSKMRVTNNTRTNAGTQEVEVSLINTTDYKWADNTIEPKKLSWTIAKKAATLTCNDARVGATLTKDIPYTYDGDGTLNVVSSDSSIVSVVSVNETNNTFTIRGEAQGTATLTLSATGSNYADVSSTISVLVFNESYGECILDTEGPEITNVASSKTGNSLTVSATITDPNLPDGTKGSGVDLTSIRYMITDTSEKPTSDDANWSEDPVFSVEHFRNNVYVWVKAKDNLGNETISDATLGMISVRINLGDTKEVPYIYSGTGTVVATPQTSGIVTITGIDQSNKIISIKADAVGKTAINVTADGKALTTIYAVVYKDSCGGCILDTTGPSITDMKGERGEGFVTISATITDPDLPDGTKGSGVDTTSTRYMITQENVKPASEATEWSTSNILSTTGFRGTAYIWIKAKDNVGNETIVGSAFQLIESIIGFTAEITGNYTYTGNPIIPPDANISLKNGTKVLVKGQDYNVTYENNINSGTATATFEGIGDYKDTITVEFTIGKKPVTIVWGDTTLRYNGMAQTPAASIDTGVTVDGVKEEIVLEIEGAQINEGENYVATATMVRVEGGNAKLENYQLTNSPTTTFRILPGFVTMPNIEDKVYNTREQSGVYGGEHVSLSGDLVATDVGTYYVTLTPDEHYVLPTGVSASVTWKITPRDINETNIQIDPLSFVYNQNEIKPTIQIEYEGKVLKENEDYRVVLDNNVVPGLAKVTIVGIHNFKGTYQEVFEIRYIEIDHAELEQTVFTYTGSEIKPGVKVYDKQGNLLEEKDYIVTYLDNCEVGTATVKIKGLGYVKGETEVHFTIQALPANEASVKLVGDPYVYDGTPKCPTAEVTFHGNKLYRGVDYELDYENNIHAGENTAVAIIRFIGNYTGEIRKNFTILKAARTYHILPGKAVIKGETGHLAFSYTGDVATTTVTLENTAIASVQTKVYSREDTIDFTGLTAGKTAVKVQVAETQDYFGVTMNTEITVFETQEEAYPIYGLVMINDDAPYTISPRTMLTLNVDFADYMYISESSEKPDIDNPEWYEFSTKMPHVFDNAEGTKTIYVWFKDKNGKMSAMAMDDIILDYDADVPANDSILFDQTEIDKTKPDVKNHNVQNSGLDVLLTFKQEDVLVNGIRSGVDHSTIEYGYRETTMPEGSYTWQRDPIIKNLQYDKEYAFVTRASDRAGNGPTVSEETIIKTEKRYATTLTLTDTKCAYNGKIQTIKKVDIAIVDSTPVTGKVNYTYYVDKNCTILTSTLRDGSEGEGLAPRNPGVYYVVAELVDDTVYYDTTSNVARLFIGWDISNTTSDDVFAYPERTNPDGDTYILHVTGTGEMANLEELVNKKPANIAYWEDYKEKIVELKIEGGSGNAITNIGNDVFNHLTKITSIEIPNTVKKIGDSAFSGCTGVTEKVVIPASVEQIGKNPFMKVPTPAFEVETGSHHFDVIDGALTDISEKEFVAYPGGKADEKYTIPASIEVIKEDAFSGNEKIKDVVIPSGVTDIKAHAFGDCTNLKVVEVEDLIAGDTTISLKEVGNAAFENIANDSIIYTFSESVAKKFIEDKSHEGDRTKVYYPPVVTIHPMDRNGIVGGKVKFVAEAKVGNPAATTYQWFKVKDGVETPITGATGLATDGSIMNDSDEAGIVSTIYEADSLTNANNQEQYYCRFYNDSYYFDRGYVNSQKATLTILENAYYKIKHTEDDYLFGTLQSAFDFAKDADTILTLKDVPNEGEAVLDKKNVLLDLSGNRITLEKTIQVENESKLELVGTGNMVKTGEYILKNKGEVIVRGDIEFKNTTGCGIQTLAGSKLIMENGTILVDYNAIYAVDATVALQGENVTIIANTTAQNASITMGASGISGPSDATNAVTILKESNFTMSAGSVSISYQTERNTGEINAIYLDQTVRGMATITGGQITATKAETVAAQGSTANGITVAGKASVIIDHTVEGEGSTASAIQITGSTAGIVLSKTNQNGNVLIKNGTVKGNQYGILNKSNGAKAILGVADRHVSITEPIIIGEKVAIFNTNEKAKMEMYDGILYAKSENVIYEAINRETIDTSITDRIYTEDGRDEIKIEDNYSFYIEEENNDNGTIYHAVYLKENRLPTMDPIDLPTIEGDKTLEVEVGQKGTMEVHVSGGYPEDYEFEWQISTDNGNTWIKLTVGTGYDTNRYTTPIAQLDMDGYFYRCVVRNAAGEIASDRIKLKVIDSSATNDGRPVGRIIFPDGKILVPDTISSSNEDNLAEIHSNYALATYAEMADTPSDNVRKMVNMQLIIKSFAKLDSIYLNGASKNLLADDTFQDGKYLLGEMGIVYKDGNSVKHLVKEVKDKNGNVVMDESGNPKTEIVEYTYTFNMKINKNGIITAEFTDENGRNNTVTQTVDIFYELKLDYSISNLTSLHSKVVVTFYANKPVKPIRSISGSYENGKYLELVGNGENEYSYKYTLTLDSALPETTFYFQDEYANEAFKTVETIQRVEYKNIVFKQNSDTINDMNVIEAWIIAQDLENAIEVTNKEQVQNRYGVSSMQTDIFMSRARDVGAAEIISKATSVKAYDGAYVKDIETTMTKNSIYDYKTSNRKEFISAAVATAREKAVESILQKLRNNTLPSGNKAWNVKDTISRYMDFISEKSGTNDFSHLKGMNIAGFRIDLTAPYMYTYNGNVGNATDAQTENSSFRATIVIK